MWTSVCTLARALQVLGAGLRSKHGVREVLLHLHSFLALPFICEILSLLMSVLSLVDERLFLKSNFLCSQVFYICNWQVKLGAGVSSPKVKNK